MAESQCRSKPIFSIVIIGAYNEGEKYSALFDSNYRRIADVVKVSQTQRNNRCRRFDDIFTCVHLQPNITTKYAYIKPITAILKIHRKMLHDNF